MLEVPVSTPFVSVVIPVFNDAARLRTCLQAVAAQTYPADAFEVLVVDNASTEDLAPSVPHDPRFQLLHEPVPGSYAARNRALQTARGEVLAFTDGDCVPDPAWLQRGVARLVGPPFVDYVAGAVELFYEGGGPTSAAELYEFRHGFPQEFYLREQHFGATANVLTWREVVERVGPFDARLKSRGDAEFGQRVHAAGLVQVYDPQVVVRHPARATAQELLVKFRRTSLGTRDADLRAGAGRLHFAGLAARQAYLTARSAAAVLVLGQPPHGLGAKLRYLGLYLRLRWLQVRVYGGQALRPASGAVSGS